MPRKTIFSLTISGLILGLLMVACEPDTLDTKYRSEYPLAEEEGLNGKALEWLVEDIKDGDYGEVRSLVIMRNDRIVLEEYFSGFERDDLQPLFSITKSVLSALIGIAFDQGYIDSLDKPMLDYFEEYETIQNLDNRKKSITIRHLLSMSAGLDWNELAVPYSDPSNIFNLWYYAEDQIQIVLDQPVVTQPGTFVNYNSGLSQLLSIILTKETGQSASEYAAENLFNRLDITDWSWSTLKLNDSVNNGGWGLSLRPVDLVKFGQLYLQQGYWGSMPVVPENWVRTSTDSLGIMSIRTNYGYQWSRYSNRMVEAGFLDRAGIYFGSDYSGQYLWIIPYYNMIALVTAANGDDYLLNEAILWEYLLRIISNAQ